MTKSQRILTPCVSEFVQSEVFAAITMELRDHLQDKQGFKVETIKLEGGLVTQSEICLKLC
jgi:hypothetical protein